MEKITVNSEELDNLKKKYPAASPHEIEEWASRKCEEFSKMSDEMLIKYGFKEGRKEEFNPVIKDSLTFYDNTYKDLKIKDIEPIEDLHEIYEKMICIFKKYVDMNESYYPIVACWTIGTYFHNEMLSYPYLYFNAMKGSGKSRLMKLITFLSWEGEMLNSMTEAVLFRTKGTLGIDEFENIGKKGSENIRELLNSCYKRGTKVKRMKKKKTMDGEEQVVEQFEVFRPIVVANISGMEDVLGDRTLPLYLEKSTSSKTKLMEIFEFDSDISTIKNQLSTYLHRQVEFGRGRELLQGIYTDWNKYISTSLYLSPTLYNTLPNSTFFKIINEMEINGRMLELTLPLFIVGMKIGEDVLTDLIKSLKEILEEKRQEEFVENKDIFVYDFVSQRVETPTEYYVSIKELTQQFREFMQSNEEWISVNWVGLSLKRLSLAKKKRRIHGRTEVILDIHKAQEKIKIFRPSEPKEETK